MIPVDMGGPCPVARDHLSDRCPPTLNEPMSSIGRLPLYKAHSYNYGLYNIRLTDEYTWTGSKAPVDDWDRVPPGPPFGGVRLFSRGRP